MSQSFIFTDDNLKIADKFISRYPSSRQKSAILPLLDLAQRQNGGWLSVAAIEYVAGKLAMPYIRAYEVASFYSMFNLKPVGKYHLQFCTTTPCWLRGSDDILKICENKLNIKLGETTPDGLFTLNEVQCLGACRAAPLIQINDDYYENLDAEKTAELLEKLKQ